MSDTSSEKAFHPIPAVVIYQDPATRRQVEQLFDRLAQGTLHPLEFPSVRIQFQTVWIPWDRLGNETPTREETAFAAVEAALVVFSIRLRTMPPEPVKQWIESWLPAKHLQASALILMGHPYERPAPGGENIRRDFEEVARQGRMNFFYQRPGLGRDPTRPSRSSARFPRKSLRHSELLYRARPWPGGLNE